MTVQCSGRQDCEKKGKGQSPNVKNAAKAEIENTVLLATSISQTIWSIGAGCSTLPCSAKDLEHVFQRFDKGIPNITDTVKVKI